MIPELRYERVIDASPAAVFGAFTSAAGQEAFYGQDDAGWVVESSCELRVGGEWAITFGASTVGLYVHRHLIRDIDVPRRLLLATTELRPDGTTLAFTTEFLFADHGGRTVMTMIQRGLADPVRRAEHARGVPTAFHRLVALVATA